MNFKSGTKQIDQFFFHHELSSGPYFLKCWVVMAANGYAIMTDRHEVNQ